MVMERSIKEVVYIREMVEELMGKKSKSVKLIIKTDNEALNEAVNGNKFIDVNNFYLFILHFSLNVSFSTPFTISYLL